MLENAYLLEGLFRWNADRASAAVSTDLSTETNTYSGVLDLVELSPTQLFNSIIFLLHLPFLQKIALPKAWQETLPIEQQRWMSKALYHFNPSTGKSKIKKDLKIWWFPPEPVHNSNQPPASPDTYFLEPFFLWAPQRIWAIDLRCIEECKANQAKQNVKVQLHIGLGFFKVVFIYINICYWHLYTVLNDIFSIILVSCPLIIQM